MPALTTTTEQTNRAMLRVRDAIDRDDAAELHVDTLARLAHVSPAHLIRPSRYRARGRLPPAPGCFTMAWTRPSAFVTGRSSSFGEVAGGPDPWGRSHEHHVEPPVLHLRPRPGRSARVLRRGARPRGRHRRRPRLHALADRPRPGDTKEILLERPGPPAHDPQTAEEVRALVAKGAGGGWLGFQTDDVDRVHADLVARGVEITQPPSDESYGRDMGLRDPFGNNIRIGNITA